MRSAKAKFIVELNEAIASIASTQDEVAALQQEAATLEKEYKVFMKGCKKKIEWIMFQDICAYLKVRAKVMKFSKVSPPEKIVDCGVSAWIPGECSVPCDDKCPNKDPYKCGGTQTLTREVVVKNNQFGLLCPMLARKRKCNQVKCPVNCRQSRWSRYSKCSKDCEGGAQSRTRSILVQPKNGGQACNTAAETRPCNTGSCDRNCRLKKWTQWSPCSVACGGGLSERVRKVLIPIRGNGKCPKTKSRIRHGIKRCNSHRCRGDEVCIAKQDLILSIDGSGSLRESGFKILKSFVTELVKKYRGDKFGVRDQQIGIVQFGNGQILKDGTIADAKDILPLTNDMKKVAKAVEGLVHLKGFTNMAQAFGVAEKLLLLGGRKAAQSAVMTITDGKPSFIFQTNEKVLQLKDKHTKLFFVPITEFKGEELKLMKKWASTPWPTNLVHVPGLDALASSKRRFVQRCLVKFCPEAKSASNIVVPKLRYRSGGDWTTSLCRKGETIIGGGCHAAWAWAKMEKSGPKGSNGWECGGHGGRKRVWATCAKGAKTTIKEKQVGDWGQVYCDAGQNVLGGGCQANAAPHHFQYNGPVGRNGWKCGGHGGKKKIWVICSTDIKPIVRSTRGGDWHSVWCPVGSKIISGGCNAFSRPYRFEYNAPAGRSGRRWMCGGHTSSKRAWVICSP